MNGEFDTDRVLRAVSLDRYRLSQIGSYTDLRHALAFCADPALWGFAAWGAPRRDEIERLVALVALELAGGVAPHATLADLRGLDGGDLPTFAPLIQHMTSLPERAARKITRMAVVRPPGVLGMTITGFFHVVRVPYPVAIFDDLPSAAAWTGAAPHLHAPLQALLSHARSADSFLFPLRSWLASHLIDASLAGAALALARSPRSLQRDLQLAGTTFRAQFREARVRHAQRELLDNSRSLTRIANDLGCASLQHFSLMFRAHTGSSPAQWRAHQRSESR